MASVSPHYSSHEQNSCMRHLLRKYYTSTFTSFEMLLTCHTKQKNVENIAKIFLLLLKSYKQSQCSGAYGLSLIELLFISSAWYLDLYISHKAKQFN